MIIFLNWHTDKGLIFRSLFFSSLHATYAIFYFFLLFQSSNCNFGCFCLSLRMVRGTSCRQDGSLSWTRRSWSSPERKSYRSLTRALSKTSRVCSRSVTRRRSWSLAGGRSTVISQRWGEEKSQYNNLSPAQINISHSFVPFHSWKIWLKLRAWRKRGFPPLWKWVNPAHSSSFLC